MVRLADGGAADVSDELAALLDRLRAVDPGRFFKFTSKFEADLRERHPGFDYDEWLDPARADWTVVGESVDGDVLDLGGGYGATARTLATHGASVTLVDRDLDALRFAAFAARVLDVDGLRPVHAHVDAPPLTPESFDAVVWNRAWDETGTSGGAPPGTDDARVHSGIADAPIRSLERVRSLLRPGGSLYLRAPNRRDPRRAFAEAVSLASNARAAVGDLAAHDRDGSVEGDSSPGAARRRESGGSGCHARSLSGYERTLRRAGFRSIDANYAYPDAEVPQFVFSDREAFGDLVGRKLAATAARNVPGVPATTARRVAEHLPTASISRFAPAFVLEARR